MTTDIAALRLNVRIDEGQGPVVVLLHGINSTADDMRPLVDLLRPDHRVIAPDLLGFGDSPKPLDIDYTTDEHARVLAATLTNLDLPGRFLMLGYSLGGDIAARHAAAYPEQVRRLFLLSTPFYLPPEHYVKHRFGTRHRPRCRRPRPARLRRFAGAGVQRLLAGGPRRRGAGHRPQGLR